MKQFRVKPISLKDANAFVARHHRHHKPVVGHKFSISLVSSSGEVIGVVIVGRPVSRVLDNGETLEVNRCCTDGTPNACSALYRAAWRAASAMGYQKLVTYTLPSEGGTSLKGAGFTFVGTAGGHTWNMPSRPRVDKSPVTTKWRWELTLPTPAR